MTYESLESVRASQSHVGPIAVLIATAIIVPLVFILTSEKEKPIPTKKEGP